jgi:N-acyl-D-aspartate/D-glutamate deacylase
MANWLLGMAPRMFELGESVDYLPGPDQMLGARATRAGVPFESFLYDLLLKDEGRAILYAPMANYVGCSSAAIRDMMAHPLTILGLGDGGAHYGVICDTSFTTFTLSYWTRDVAEDRRFPVEWAIAQLSRKPAETVGLLDRGLLAPGYRADLNVIDMGRLALGRPFPKYDLPGGGRRMQQKADGYEMTVVNGVVTYRDGEPTGNLPGRLVRGTGYRRDEAA